MAVDYFSEWNRIISTQSYKIVANLGVILLHGHCFHENCMKMKEIRQRGGRTSLVPPRIRQFKTDSFLNILICFAGLHWNMIYRCYCSQSFRIHYSTCRCKYLFLWQSIFSQWKDFRPIKWIRRIGQNHSFMNRILLQSHTSRENILL